MWKNWSILKYSLINMWNIIEKLFDTIYFLAGIQYNGIRVSWCKISLQPLKVEDSLYCIILQCYKIRKLMVSWKAILFHYEPENKFQFTPWRPGGYSITFKPLDRVVLEYGLILYIKCVSTNILYMTNNEKLKNNVTVNYLAEITANLVKFLFQGIIFVLHPQNTFYMISVFDQENVTMVLHTCDERTGWYFTISSWIEICVWKGYCSSSDRNRLLENQICVIFLILRIKIW